MARKTTAAHTTRYVKAGKGRHSYEHQRIAAAVLGRPVPAGVQVHHVDGNGRNNTRRNLVICDSQRYHQILHARARVLVAGGDPNADAWCSICQHVRPLRMFWIRKSGRRVGRPSSECRYCTMDRIRVARSVRRIHRQIHSEGAAGAA